jgi:hypothetical protein
LKTSHSTNISKLHHLQRHVKITGLGSAQFSKGLETLHSIHSTVISQLKLENRQYKLSDLPSTAFQSFPALDFSLHCFTPVEAAHPSYILDPDPFIDPDQVLKSILGSKLVYTRENVISFTAADSLGR